MNPIPNFKKNQESHDHSVDGITEKNYRQTQKDYYPKIEFDPYTHSPRAQFTTHFR